MYITIKLISSKTRVFQTFMGKDQTYNYRVYRLNYPYIGIDV